MLTYAYALIWHLVVVFGLIFTSVVNGRARKFVICWETIDGYVELKENREAWELVELDCEVCQCLGRCLYHTFVMYVMLWLRLHAIPTLLSNWSVIEWDLCRISGGCVGTVVSNSEYWPLMTVTSIRTGGICQKVTAQRCKVIISCVTVLTKT